MRLARMICALLVVSCLEGSNTATTIGPTSTSLAPPTTAPTTEVTPTGCSAPPVPFSLLCEVADLVEEEHLSPPTVEALAEAATPVIGAFSWPEPASAPATVRCAVPAVEFVDFCQAIETRLRNDPVPLEPLMEAVVEQMLAHAVDPYSRYVPPRLANELSENGVIAGAGVVIGARNSVGSPCVLISDACPLIVELVIAGGPAEQAGLSQGDRVITVNGDDVRDRTVSQVASDLTVDTPAPLLTIEREGAEVNVTLAGAEEPLPVAIDLAGNTGYLRLAEFGLDAHLYVHFALEALIEQGAELLILDLRGNPGGYLFSVSIIGSEFLADGLLYKTFSPREDRDFPAVGGGIATALPLFVLVDGSSASSAEILAATLQERGRATVVGVPTFGKNLVQDSFELRNGGILRLTTAEWTTPNGASVADIGLQPDVLLEIEDRLPPAELIAKVLEAVR
ncbi:MAG TPA: S41 family peptidase [Acidimicrobiia bacterium]|nr:S41 family peptidase [Acidimicrobiia bacterium]